MKDSHLIENQVEIIGEIASEFKFSHETLKEKFYEFYIKVERVSGNTDVIPAIISEKLIDVNENYTGEIVKINGQLRSYNEHTEDGKSKLVLHVFVRDGQFLDEKVEDNNRVDLEGTICKEPKYRLTPKGRQIADVLVAVNRPYSKSDYIPCICWGRNAVFASGFEVGDRVTLTGRIQSREYYKKLSETEGEMRVAYEVSVSELGFLV